MATIVKSYTFLDKITADASEVNRNFDDLFSTINNLNSENMASSFNHPASQVTIVDTASNYTSTEIEAALREIAVNVSSTIPPAVKGFNSIHVITQRSHGIILTPGALEINGSFHKLSSEMNITAVTMISGNIDKNNLYGLAAFVSGTGVNLSASSFRLIPLVDTSATNGADVDKNGYYFSESYRIISVLANLCSASENQSLYPYQALGVVSSPLDRVLNGSEAGHHGFNSEGAAITLDDEQYKISYNAETNRYCYQITDTVSATGTIYSFALPLTYGYSANGQGAMGYLIKDYTYYQAAGSYYGNNPVGGGVSATGAVRMSISIGAASGVIENAKLNVSNPAGGATSTWVVSLAPNSFVGKKSF